MRLSRRDPRLETVLQTTRRVPETELEQFVPTLVPDSGEVTLEKERLLAQKIAEEDAAIFARSKKFVFVKKVRAPKLTAAEIAAAELEQLFDTHITERNFRDNQRSSFFQRSYSTTTSRTLISTAKLIALQGRLATPEGEQSTPFNDLTARARVKARLAARGRVNFVASTDFMINAGGLDPRFLRYKSPRNRQYELRKVPTPVAKMAAASRFTELARFHEKREYLLSQRTSDQIARLRRRHFYIGTPITADPTIPPAVADAREYTPLRRTLTALRAQSALAKQQALDAQFHNFPNRKQLTFVSSTDHAKRALLRKEARFFETRPLLRGQLSQY